MTQIDETKDGVRESGERAEAGLTSAYAEQPTLSSPSLAGSDRQASGWLDDVRDSIEAPGKYLAMFAEGRAHVFELHAGWSRIGRAANADIRLDDPTVSRRHAVVVRTPEGELRVLDDRSMNGLSINGESVDWAPIEDGDELEIGRYTLHIIETAGARQR